MRETRVQSLGWEDTLEKAMAPHSSILAWRIPSTEEPGGLQSTGLQRVRHDWTTSLSSGGLVFQLVCRFHRYWAYSSKSTVQLKMESRFQDRACSASSFTTTKGLHAATKTRCKSNKQIKINERFSWWLSVKESACQGSGHRFDPWPGKIPHVSEHSSPCPRTTEPVL